MSAVVTCLYSPLGIGRIRVISVQESTYTLERLKALDSSVQSLFIPYLRHGSACLENGVLERGLAARGTIGDLVGRIARVRHYCIVMALL